MFPIIFSIGEINIYSHGVLMVLGGFLGSLVIYSLAKKFQSVTFNFLEYILVAFIGGLIGARILYVLAYPDQYANIWEKLSFWNGGMVSFGGMIGGISAAAAYLRFRQQPIWPWFDIGIIGLLLGQAIGRIGCFLTGDVNGYYTLLPLAIQARYPVALMETIWIVLFLPILYYLFLKKRSVWPSGIFFALGLMLYSLGRFAIDFFRDDSYFIGFLSYSQIGSGIVILVAFSLIFAILKGERKESNARTN